MVTGDIEQERLIIPSGLITKDKCDWSLAEFYLTGKTDNSSEFRVFSINRQRKGNKVHINVGISCHYGLKTDKYWCEKMKSFEDGRVIRPPELVVKASEYTDIESMKVRIELKD